MRYITSNSHEEIHVARAMVIISVKSHDNELLGDEEWEIIGICKNITFNDVYISYTDEEGKQHYKELNGRTVKAYPFGDAKMEKPEPHQIDIFEILGE